MPECAGAESGQRQPSIPALARPVDAAGFDLTLVLQRPPSHLRRLSGPVGRRVRRHRKDLVAVAAATSKASSAPGST